MHHYQFGSARHLRWSVAVGWCSVGPTMPSARVRLFDPLQAPTGRISVDLEGEKGCTNESGRDEMTQTDERRIDY